MKTFIWYVAAGRNQTCDYSLQWNDISCNADRVGIVTHAYSAKFAKYFHDRHTDSSDRLISAMLCNLHLYFWVPFILYLHFWRLLRTKRHNYTFNILFVCEILGWWFGIWYIFVSFVLLLFLISWDYLFFLIHYFFFLRPRVRNVFVCLSE